MPPRDRVPVERRRRRPTRAGTVLTAELIVDTALELIDAPGGALTVRRLGAELGADPSAIYRYFRDTDALLLAVADRLIGDMLTGLPDAAGWREGLRAFAFRVRDSMLLHPRLAVLRAARVTGGRNELRAVEAGVGLLLEAGFAPASAVRHYLDFVDTVLALAAVDAAVRDLGPKQRAADAELWERAYAAPDAGEYPVLHAVREHLPAMAEPVFADTVDLLLTGLEARLAAERASG
ncbi:TetR/AcrR family transcriptional regulator [Actinomadura parmotrematis]|uniref:TetR/AcrR family transcriptional regulator n=1 Tax=Actinomadura parmotrematis TaxID=2864039 RepID=A0ABS7G4N1_9ACTN|nr:TetR/AcrR family transcriptional regulator C-terminal domain-containing protein [Actinomadura parmotrematis]MBW8487701.1 TetR/AcrR family transcriptional regulator [Actinomadura parmotrematis]